MARIAIALFLSFALLPASALAQARDPSARRTELVAASQKGPEFKVGRQSYRVVVGMQAVPRGESNAEQRAAALGLPPSDVVEQKGPYAVVRRAPSGATAALRLAAASAVAEVGGAESFPVVVNTGNGQLGIVSGALVVKMGNVEEAAALAKANGLAVEYVSPSIGYAFLKAPAGKDVFAVAAALRGDPRVASATAEIREHFTVAR